MEIVRSKVSITHDTTGCEKFFNDLKNNFSWYSTDSTNNRWYISADTYLEYTDTDNDTYHLGNEIRLYNTSAWNGNYAVIKNLNGAYINFQIFKYSETCCAISFSTNNDGLTTWDPVPLIAIDTHDGGETMIAFNGVDGTSIGAADGTSPLVMQPWSYKGYDSVKSDYAITQIVPLVVPRSGFVADHLHSVLFAPVSSGQLVSLDVGGSSQMFYFSRGLAIPCGSSISYTNLT